MKITAHKDTNRTLTFEAGLSEKKELSQLEAGTVGSLQRDNIPINPVLPIMSHRIQHENFVLTSIKS